MEQKQTLADRLKQANNILVTVSSNPSVDQLASCIGLTLALNKLEKHATAVFSGAVPDTIEFLQPEKTLEKNTDSLRDFIIALDKSKADKLRYKVEDTVVKIFITPYKTSISDKDLEFSQGDFNVDVVLALGVHNQADLDTAITSHGRILHDATVATVNTQPGGELGTVNWLEQGASSLSELAAELVDAIDKSIMDTQIATAFLTGIVAETDRFSNDKTSPLTMTISAELMAAGANQQLVATKLEPPAPAPQPVPEPPKENNDNNDEHKDGQNGDQPPAEPPKPDDGTLEISHVGEPEHKDEPKPDDQQAPTPPEPEQHDDQPAQPEQAPEPPKEPEPAAPAPEPEHVDTAKPVDESAPAFEKPAEPEQQLVPQIKIDEQGGLQMHDGDNLPPLPPKQDLGDPTIRLEKQHMILQPPTLGGQLSGAMPEDEERPAGDPAPSPTPYPSPSGILQRGPSAASFPTGQPTFPTGPQQAPIMTPQQPIVPGDAAPFAAPTPPLPPPVVAPQPPFPSSMPSAPAPIAEPVFPPAPPVMTPAPAPMPPAFQPAPFTPPAPVAPQQPPTQTLSEIEQNVNSPHLQQFLTPPPAAPAGGQFMSLPSEPQPALASPFTPPAPAAPQLPPLPPLPEPAQTPSNNVDPDAARNAVMQAYESTGDNGPPESFNAQPLGAPLHEDTPPPAGPPPITPPAPGA